MNRIKRLVFMVVTAFTFGGVMAGHFLHSARAFSQENPLHDADKAEFREYRGWKRMNPKPIVVESPNFTLDGVDN